MYLKYSILPAMIAIKNMRFLVLLFSILLTANSVAQEGEKAASPKTPNLLSLETNWWAYFDQTGDGAAQKIESFLADVGVQAARLKAPNQAIGQSIHSAIHDNITAYRALLNEPELAPQELPEPALVYSIDELLEIAAEARVAGVEAERELAEVEREQRILAGATRRRDLTFKNYLNAAAGDEKILAALRLMHDRSAQAIAARRLKLLKLRYDRANAYDDAMAARVDYAAERLATTPDTAGLDELTELVSQQELRVVEIRDNLRAAELAATGLDLETAIGRSEQRLHQQRLVEAEVALALNQVSLAELQARRWWTELQLATKPETDLMQEQALEWSELLRRVEQSAPNWQRDTEDELLAVQTVSRDGLDRAARRLLDQRLGTAQGNLNQIAELRDAAADLELVSQLVDNAVAQYSGALSSWFTGVSRNVKAISQRVMSLGDTSLFSIGEAPVTGRDILRVIIILIIAFLLSRGIRHAIWRVSRKESDGTQASLYTVGRLTHYTIVIIATIIALSSIGLDFSNLALVAGALGVGIGFGLQSIVSNFVSGLIILFEHTLRVGDYIELDTGLTGTVKAINVRSTLINTNDNIDIVVPNSEFVTTRLTNWTLGERILRVRIPFGVAYGTDKELVKKAAQEAAAEVSYTLTNMKGREPDVWLVEYGDSSLNFLLLVWVNRQGARRPTRTRAAYLWALETKLREYNIEIPFPQRDLNFRSGWPGSAKELQEAPELTQLDDAADPAR